MMRGEVWTVRGVGYAAKPRPAVVLQSDEFDGLVGSATVCMLTTFGSGPKGVRPLIEPTEENKLEHDSYAMVDKVITVAREDLKVPFGKLSDDDMLSVSEAARRFLGL